MSKKNKLGDFKGLNCLNIHSFVSSVSIELNEHIIRLMEPFFLVTYQ